MPCWFSVRLMGCDTLVSGPGHRLCVRKNLILFNLPLIGCFGVECRWWPYPTVIPWFSCSFVCTWYMVCKWWPLVIFKCQGLIQKSHGLCISASVGKKNSSICDLKNVWLVVKWFCMLAFFLFLFCKLSEHQSWSMLVILPGGHQNRLSALLRSVSKHARSLF